MKRPTIKDVAVLAGVSPSTVSRVLNGCDVGHMRPETKDRILRVIKELEYTPVKAARVLRQRRTQTIAVLLPDISNPFFALFARGVESIAFVKGYSTMICDSNHSIQKESRYLDILLAEGVEGIIFIPVNQPVMDRVQRLLRQGIKIIVADRRVEGLPVVEADNKEGSRKLTEYIIKLGYRKIAYIAGPAKVSTAEDRLKGFLEALAKAGLKPLDVKHGNFTYESGYEQAQKIIQRYQVDAIMCGNDLMAIGAVRAAEDNGLRVPEDLGVTGFDHIPWSDFLRPKLTTVEIPAFNMGQIAMHQFLKYDNKTCKLKVRIIRGESCRKK